MEPARFSFSKKIGQARLLSSKSNFDKTSLPPLPVELRMHITEMPVCDMGVHLRGLDIGVPEERLHTAEVGAIA